MVQVLYNLAGSTYKGSNSFDDVNGNDWYNNAVSWASGLGIVTGIGNNLFAPNTEITREQIAVMLYNYMNVMQTDLPEIRGSATFNDSADISSYAKEAVNAMYQYGVLNGKGNNEFVSQGNANRAEVATMYMNFLEAMK